MNHNQKCCCCIDGDVLVFTDLHLGLKQGSKSRLAICVNVVNEIIQHIKSHSIKACLFLGDWHHVRVSTENSVLDVSYKLMSSLAKSCPVWCILGNHDIYMKNAVDISSMVAFSSIPNVHIISKPTQLLINGKSALLVPWLGDLSSFSSEQFDMVFGHFDVSPDYIMKAYVEDNSVKMKASASLSSSLDADSMLNTGSSSSASDFVGDFVDIAKRGGLVMSGHLHGSKRMKSKGRDFVFAGSPYQQNLGERSNTCGFWTISAVGALGFHEVKSAPKHVEVRMSDVLKDIDAFNFKAVRGSILHKIYDIDVDSATDAKVSQRLNDWHPYEELLPDYDVQLPSSIDAHIQDESAALMKKSKLQYIKAYISNIDDAALADKSIDREKLYNMLAEYYEAAADEK